MLLWKTRAETVSNRWHRFFEKYPDVTSLSNAPLEEVENMISPLGLSKRAECLKSMASKIIEEHDGEIPPIKEDLLGLMGIGEYAASATLCFAFDKDVAIVDTNVKRIFTRVFGCQEEEVLALAERIVPKDAGREWGYSLLDLGALVCSHRPLCKECPLKSICMTGNGLT
jgi:A/G-specific adenine glycosylase